MFIGHKPSGGRVNLPPEDFLTHSVVLGRTGSGKSGLTIALLEEIAKSGSSALVLDPKGDLTNLALSLSSEREFAGLVNNAPDVRLAHGEGLAQSGLGFADVERWRNAVDVTIYAPGKVRGGGKSVSVFPTFTPPSGNFSRSTISRDVSLVLQSLGEGDDPYSPALIFLTSAVSVAWEERRFLPVSVWAGVLNDPPEKLQSFGGMSLEEFFPKRQRTKLARKLIGFQHEADRWLKGPPLNLRNMLNKSKPEIAVFSLRHLTEEDRQFFATLLLNKVVEFMFETEASDRLKLMVVLDEARGYLPPYPHNPPTKAPICTILAQGRAQGIGMLVGTQNPMDLDYKALSNVGTWFVGRLRERDCARDLVTELSTRNVSLDDVADMPQRSFLLLDKRGGHQRFQTRWCLNYLFGPMSGEQLARLEPGETPPAPRRIAPTRPPKVVVRPTTAAPPPNVVATPVPYTELVIQPREEQSEQKTSGIVGWIWGLIKVVVNTALFLALPIFVLVAFHRLILFVGSLGSR